MSLRVRVDGAPLDEGPAQAFWKRFSAWMEDHAGDLAGFARAEGLLSVHPRMEGGEPVLVASRTVPQGAYVPARAEPGAPGGKRSSGRANAPKTGEKPRRRPR
jgi:hypothetical protein